MLGMLPPVIKLTMLHKFRTFQITKHYNLHHWFQSYGGFAVWGDFSDWWICMGKGLPQWFWDQLFINYTVFLKSWGHRYVGKTLLGRFHLSTLLVKANFNLDAHVQIQPLAWNHTSTKGYCPVKKICSENSMTELSAER